jgi:hypothetical protein
MTWKIIQLRLPSEEDLTVENGFTHTAERDQPFREPIRGNVTIDIGSELEQVIGLAGRMISASKSSYRQQFPDHEVLFNACIFTEDGTQVWFGDLDLSIEHERLQQAAQRLATTLIVTPEQPFRWNGLSALGQDLYSDQQVKRFSPRTDQPQSG